VGTRSNRVAGMKIEQLMQRLAKEYTIVIVKHNMQQASGISAERMGQGTILIVDDEREIRELISFNLGREGFRTIPAKSGEEALELAGHAGD
jgi:PleD family two-component response regulator